MEIPGAKSSFTDQTNKVKIERRGSSRGTYNSTPRAENMVVGGGVVGAHSLDNLKKGGNPLSTALGFHPKLQVPVPHCIGSIAHG